MAGNVQEWVEDRYREDYDGAPTDGSAWLGPPDTDHRVMRGGGFLSTWPTMRSSLRVYGAESAFGAPVGLRCCRTF